MSLLETVKLVGDLSWYRKVFIPKIIAGKEIYKELESQTGIPAAFVACVHARELASDVGVFKAYLGNGQPLNKVTTIVPKGRGPFGSWFYGAIDALVNLKQLDQIKNWDLETCLTEWEKYNGLGYKKRGVNSPYVWSGTNHGEGVGLFVKDGVYDKNATDKNLGCYALYLLMIEVDKDFEIKNKGDVVVEEKKGFWASLWDFIKDLFTSKPTETVYKYITKIPVYGETSDNVAVVQTQLNTFSYGLKVDRQFGPATKKAIADFQKKNGLQGSGIIGDKTIQFLGIKIDKPIGDIIKQEKVYATAYKEIGVKEVVGKNHNPRILEYHDTTGNFSDDETSWCGSFIQWCLKQNGITGLDPSKAAGARNWLQFGTSTKTPKQGDIVVFWRESMSSWKGHVAFYSYETATHIYVLGGNQSNAVNVSAYPKGQLLGYRTY